MSAFPGKTSLQRSWLGPELGLSSWTELGPPPLRPELRGMACEWLQTAILFL